MRTYIPNGCIHHESSAKNGSISHLGIVDNITTGDSFLLTNRSWRQINHAFSELPGLAIDHFLQEAEGQEQVRVLDVGAGIKRSAANGLSQAYRNRKGLLHVIGVDLTASNKKVRASKVMGDAWNLPLPDDSVNVAYSYMSLSIVSRANVARLRDGLAEVTRVLKPGGIFFIDATFHASLLGDSLQLNRIAPDGTNIYSTRLGNNTLGSLSMFFPSLAWQAGEITGRQQFMRHLAITKGSAETLMGSIATDSADIRPLIIGAPAESPT